VKFPSIVVLPHRCIMTGPHRRRRPPGRERGASSPSFLSLLSGDESAGDLWGLYESQSQERFDRLFIQPPVYFSVDQSVNQSHVVGLSGLHGKAAAQSVEQGRTRKNKK